MKCWVDGLVTLIMADLDGISWYSNLHTKPERSGSSFNLAYLRDRHGSQFLFEDLVVSNLIDSRKVLKARCDMPDEHIVRGSLSRTLWYQGTKNKIVMHRWPKPVVENSLFLSLFDPSAFLHWLTYRMHNCGSIDIIFCVYGRAVMWIKPCFHGSNICMGASYEDVLESQSKVPYISSSSFGYESCFLSQFHWFPYLWENTAVTFGLLLHSPVPWFYRSQRPPSHQLCHFRGQRRYAYFLFSENCRFEKDFLSHSCFSGILRNILCPKKFTFPVTFCLLTFFKKGKS